MSKLEDWIQKRREQNVRSFEEVKEQILAKAVPLDFRLEFLLNSDATTLVIRGDLKGLAMLKDDISGLIEMGSIGNHFHREDGHGLTKANVSVIVQLVSDDEKDDGPHNSDKIVKIDR